MVSILPVYLKPATFWTRILNIAAKNWPPINYWTSSKYYGREMLTAVWFSFAIREGFKNHDRYSHPSYFKCLLDRCSKYNCSEVLKPNLIFVCSLKEKVQNITATKYIPPPPFSTDCTCLNFTEVECTQQLYIYVLKKMV